MNCSTCSNWVSYRRKMKIIAKCNDFIATLDDTQYLGKGNTHGESKNQSWPAYRSS